MARRRNTRRRNILPPLSLPASASVSSKRWRSGVAPTRHLASSLAAREQQRFMKATVLRRRFHETYRLPPRYLRATALHEGHGATTAGEPQMRWPWIKAEEVWSPLTLKGCAIIEERSFHLRSEERMARVGQTVTVRENIGAAIDRMLGAPSRVSARLHQRLQIVKMASDGKLNVEIARELNVDPQRVRRWRKRWARRSGQLEAAERRMLADREMESIIAGILADELRSGAPSKFTAEQLTKLIGVACEKPEDSGIPTSHWTIRSLTLLRTSPRRYSGEASLTRFRSDMSGVF